MSNKALRWMLSAVAVAILAVGICARAQAPTPTHFSGLINDYSPETISGKVVGPWEMHGKWSLDLRGRSGLADFSAEMTMELSDHAMEVAIANAIAAGAVPPSFDDPETRIPHTHHITMKDAEVSYPVAGVCPAYATPNTTTLGIMVTGSAYITGNGGPAPFSKNDTVLSTLQVCVNGGTDVPFSNVTLVFGAPANGHFGMQAIHGVVRQPRTPDRDDDHDNH
ncbi:MAG: hypothetical protein WB680_00425 [Candidatus Acidiferrales bacterium]